jgi:hypothetical protein
MTDGTEVTDPDAVVRATSVSAAHQGCTRLEAGRAHKRRPLRTVWPRRAARPIPHDNVRSLVRDDLAEPWRISRLDCWANLENVARRQPSCDCRLEVRVDHDFQAGDAWVPSDSCEGPEMRPAYFHDSIIYKRSHRMPSRSFPFEKDSSVGPLFSHDCKVLTTDGGRGAGGRRQLNAVRANGPAAGGPARFRDGYILGSRP